MVDITRPLLADLIPAEPAALADDEVAGLWEIFVRIGERWSEGTLDPNLQRSQWREFVEVRTREAPSYVGEYRNALRVLEALRQRDGAAVWDKLFAAPPVPCPAPAPPPPTTGYAHLRVYVVDEFIKVWLTSGGFRVFGAGNFNSYVSGSRFAVRPPYRRPLATTAGGRP